MSAQRAFQAVVMGASAGGFDALQAVLNPLPAAFPLPILIVLHREASSNNGLPRLLGYRCALPIKEAEDKEPVSPGGVYLAPANYHLLVERDHRLSLSVDPRVCFARPAIDVLFETAADAYRAGLVGILLSGANNDGTDGMRAIKRRGGLTIAQDPAGAQSAAMPRYAIEANVVDRVLPLAAIAPFLLEIAAATAPLRLEVH